MINRNPLLAILGTFTLLLQAACIAGPQDVRDPSVKHLSNTTPKRILFVGNSYLYYNDSLHNHVKRIVAEQGVADYADLQYKSSTIGGAALSHHNLDSLLESGRLGIDEPFDLVILQGGSAEPLSERRRATFNGTATELNAKIRATGAEAALYMTPAYVKPHARFDPNMTDVVAETYVATGNRLGALVIPVGIAFEKAYQRRPDIILHKTFDGSHPSMLGTYLAACVVYASLYERPATGISYDYFGEVGKEDAAFLQAIADETVQEFFGRSAP